MLTDDRFWGAIPIGFKRVLDQSGNRLVVRQDIEQSISISLCRGKDGLEESAPFQGRAKLKSVRLENGATALIRAYRHGGFLRAISGGLFLTWPPRPFRELTITEELRRRGFPTVEVYGACIERVWGPFYRGWIVTRELEEAQDLWTAFQSGLVARLGAEKILRAVAASVRALHREGVYHRDMNLKNILVRAEAGAVKGYIIDFDKAKLMLGHVPAGLAKKNLARLLRSARKLDPEQKYFTSALWSEFVGLYHNGDPRAL